MDYLNLIFLIIQIYNNKKHGNLVFNMFKAVFRISTVLSKFYAYLHMLQAGGDVGESMEIAGAVALGTKVIRCNFCRAHFTNAQSLEGHVNGIHLRKMTCWCTDCGQSFMWRAQLSRHRRRGLCSVATSTFAVDGVIDAEGDESGSGLGIVSASSQSQWLNETC